MPLEAGMFQSKGCALSKWIVLAAGALMSVSGLWWLWDGLGIVQVERGWSAVIAGAVIFSAGAVLMGLSALIRQVESLASAMRAPASAGQLERESDLLEKTTATVPPPIAPVAPQSGQALDAQERDVLDRPEAHEPVEKTQDLRPQEMIPPVLRPAPSLPRASVPEFTLGTPSVSEADHQPAESAETGASEARAPEARREAPRLYASRQDSQGEDAGRQPPPAGNATASAHWKSLLTKARASERDTETGAAPAVLSPVAQQDRAPNIPAQRSGGDSEGRIARRYESQGVRYSLFEDGSIDAETDTGTYRFGSLTELRAFLDKRED
jgi:hypothetical protein